MKTRTCETDQLGVAAYVVMKGQDIVRMEWRSKGRYCYFIFNHTPEVIASMTEFTTGAALVDPREYINCYITIKRTMLASRPEPAKR